MSVRNLNFLETTSMGTRLALQNANRIRRQTGRINPVTEGRQWAIAVASPDSLAKLAETIGRCTLASTRFRFEDLGEAIRVLAESCYFDDLRHYLHRYIGLPDLPSYNVAFVGAYVAGAFNAYMNACTASPKAKCCRPGASRSIAVMRVRQLNPLEALVMANRLISASSFGGTIVGSTLHPERAGRLWAIYVAGADQLAYFARVLGVGTLMTEELTDAEAGASLRSLDIRRREGGSATEAAWLVLQHRRRN